MTSRPALAALVGAIDAPPLEAMKFLTDYRNEVAHELAEKIRNTPSPRDPEDWGGLVDMGADWAADLIDPKKEEK